MKHGAGSTPPTSPVTVAQEDLFKRNLFALVVLVACVLYGLASLFQHAPVPNQPECIATLSAGNFLRITMPAAVGGFPDKLARIRELWLCAERYRAQHPSFSLAAHASLYVTMQSFCIPGSLVLSILAGGLYPPLQAVALVVCCATTGASLCYLLSACFARVVFKRLLPSTIASFERRINAHRENLLYYMIFLRVTPLVPNAFVNLSSSLVGIPFRIFVVGTALGLVPATFVHVTSGNLLRDATVVPSQGKAHLAALFGLQFVAILPVLLKRRIAAADEAAQARAAAAAATAKTTGGRVKKDS